MAGITASVFRVKFNKRICGRLARKCRWVEQHLKSSDLGSPDDLALEALRELLEQCAKDLKKFAGSGFLMRIIRSGGIPEICEMHMEELDDWIDRVQKTSPKTKDDADSDLDDDEFDQDDAIRYDIEVSNNQHDARKVFLSTLAPPRLQERAIVNPDHLGQDIELVGTFLFGNIYRGTYKGDAVYIREIGSDIHEGYIKNIKDGILLAQCLSDCSNLVRIYGFCGDRTIVTAMPANGPLNEYPGKLTSLEKVTIARKVADALVFMYDIKANAKRVVHRDIRAANVLLTDKLEPILTGLELCKEKNSLAGERPVMGESIKRWWPPERILGFGISPGSDVYSFGVLMYEISTGKDPELDADLVGLEGSGICAEYTALMQKYLHRYYNARPKIDKVFEELLSIETSLRDMQNLIRPQRNALNQRRGLSRIRLAYIAQPSLSSMDARVIRIYVLGLVYFCRAHFQNY
ncbi:kinase-like domain-containing protein [Gamsiella multidivaricata]|uniref:kinase-like domain-containing protein n=1 Tax=Gamsiella multidivaricata TaxID=101098 RepID=UPI00221FAF99|nr:kinase-like domain-containing protein [Gamsiella multidivaricata]KAI7816016.1 kinase-like domain-containing protein [Gamsiella multidivaricata]